MIEDAIIYEQPLNELIRVCLRLEQLFTILDHQVSDISINGTRNVLTTIINILQVLDRPDLKAKLAKELGQHLSNLMRLENTPHIDQVKLRQLLRQIDDLIRCFIDSNGKIGQSLREIEMLSNLRLQLTTPGGGCCFDIPLFHHWLQQHADVRMDTVRSWLNELSTIRTTIELILQLVREGTRIQEKTADHGFYQELLDPQLNLRLIRVAIPKNIVAYPEISVGRHFLSIRYYAPTVNERPAQYSNNLAFWLAYGN